MDNDQIPFEKLLDWLEGRLPAEEAGRVAEQLQSAGEGSRSDLAFLQEFLESGRAARTPAPPETVRERLRAGFRTAAQAARPASFFDRIIATLSFDSRLSFASAGVRSATAEGSRRQLIYATPSMEIALNLQPDPGTRQLTLIGQIFFRDEQSPEGIAIQVTDADGTAEQGRATSDELGEFVLGPLQEGLYSIYFDMDDLEVVIEDVHCSISA